MAQPAQSLEAEFNAARQHVTQGRLDEAEAILMRLKAVMAPHSLVFEYLGFIAQQRQDLKKAARYYKKAVKLDAACVPLKIKLAEIHLSMREVAEALHLAQSAHRREPKNIAALNLLGVMAVQSGRKAEAREFFSQAVEIDPDHFQSWHNLGRLLLGLGEWQEALQVLEKANTLYKDHMQTLTALGRAQTALGKPELAFDLLRRAQSLATNNADYCDASLHLAEAHRRAQHFDQALAVIEQITERIPGHPRALSVRAAILHERGEHAEALTLIRSLKEDQSVIEADWFPNYLEGQCLLSMQQHDDAAAAFEVANRQQSKIFTRAERDKDAYIGYVAEAIELYTDHPEKDWPPVVDGSVGADIAFINGFPRSGTTLIDAILRGHSQVAIAEESNAANTCWHAADVSIPGGRKGFAAVSDDAAAELRQHYLDQLGSDLSVDREGRKVVDRHATGLLQAGLMKRLFPAAQFFLMLRHPCDVVLSAWFSNFQPTHHTANYLSIEDTAKFYDQMMTLHTVLEEQINLRSQIIRYEDLVANLRGTVEPVLQTMGLAWEEGLETYHQSKHRPMRTASFHQVSKPIYQTATYRFEHYGPTLAPVMPILAPWVERFGYKQP